MEIAAVIVKEKLSAPPTQLLRETSALTSAVYPDCRIISAVGVGVPGVI